MIDQSKPQIAPAQAGEEVTKLWRKVNECAEALNKLRTAQETARRPVDNHLRLHPFAIYQIPNWLRSSPVSDSWLRFYVRGGRVNNIEVTETDGETYPDDETWGGTDISESLLTTEIMVTAGVNQWNFWIEVARDLSTAEVKSGNVAMPAFYASSVFNIPIGWVDSSTYSDRRVCRVRQLLRNDVFLPLTQFSVKDADCVDKSMMLFASGMW